MLFMVVLCQVGWTGGLDRWNVQSIGDGDGGQWGVEVVKGLRQLAVGEGGGRGRQSREAAGAFIWPG